MATRARSDLRDIQGPLAPIWRRQRCSPCTTVKQNCTVKCSSHTHHLRPRFRPPSHAVLSPPSLSPLLPAHIPNPKFPNHTKLIQAESRENLSSLKPDAYQTSQCVLDSAKPPQKPHACLSPWLPESLVSLVLHLPMVFHLLQGLHVCAHRWDCRAPQALLTTQQNYLAAGLR